MNVGVFEGDARVRSAGNMCFYLNSFYFFILWDT